MFLPLFANPEYIINLTLLSSALTSERKGEISLDFPALLESRFVLLCRNPGSKVGRDQINGRRIGRRYVVKQKLLGPQKSSEVYNNKGARKREKSKLRLCYGRET